MPHCNHDLRHPLYLRSALKRRLHTDLYEGGERVERSPRYLVRHPLETRSQYRVRLDRAAYRNFAAPVVDVFSAGVSEGRPPRRLPPALTLLLRDADGRGDSADVFFAEVGRHAAAAGAHFVLVDTASGETSGLPYFSGVHADDVLDWSLGDDGPLEWVTLAGREYRRGGPFAEGEEIPTVTLWTRTGWVRYARRGREYVRAGQGSHPLGRVPLVPFLFEAQSPMTGLSCLDDVASLILRIYRKDSELDKMLFDCAVPLLHGVGIRPEEVADFHRASSNVLVTREGSLAYVEPAGTSYAAMAASIGRDEAAVREIAMRMLRAPALSPESAQAKRLDKGQLDSQLARFARLCRSAEEQCWLLAAAWLGIENPVVETPWNEDYSRDETETALAAQLLDLHREKIVSRETVLRARPVRRLLPDDFDAGRDAQELAAEA